MASPATPLGRNAPAPGGIFAADALETNRSGRLTDVQRRQYGNLERDTRKGERTLALVFAVMGVLVFTATGPNANAWFRPIGGIAFIAIAAVLVLHSLPGADRLSQDLRRGEVLSIEGAMEKHSLTSHGGRGSSSTSYYLDVADKHFETARVEYDAAPSAGYVRLFYLPSSHKVVNLERLADPPLPNGGAISLDDVKTVLHDVGHTKGEAHHEAMARLEQLSETVRPELVEHPVRPQQPSGPPLAEAILGTWSGGPVTFTFDPDGTASMRTFAGRVEKGRWSVDPQGRLHAELMGREQVGEAWVDGDALTLSMAGEGIKLRRAAGG